MTEESEDTSVLTKSTKRRMQVSLLDDTVVVFDVEPRSKGDLLYRKVNAHLNLEEAEYFGLQFYDSEGNVCWLDPLKPINRQIREPTKVTFKFRVMFYTPDPNSVMEYTKYLFTLQVRRDLLDGRLYCSEDTGALLASYIVQGELGDYDPLSHKEGYLSGFQFVPNQTPEVEERIVEYHKSHRGQSPAEADHNMLEVARQLEMYGITLYPAKDSDGVDLSLAVYHMGILVYQDRHRMNMFSWAKIRKLSFKKKRFLIKLHPQVHDTDIVEFLLQSRNACKGFWKICIAHHSFFRQRTAANPNKKSSILSRGSKYRYSGRTQKQILDESRDVYHPAAETDRNRSSRFSNRNDVSYAKSPPSTIVPHSPSSPPPAFNTFTETQSGPHHSTPSKRSEMSEDDGSFTLNESESSRKNSSQADDVFVNHVQEGTPALNSCEEHQVIKIYHRDTQEDVQQSFADEEAPERNTREPFGKPEMVNDKPLVVEAIADEMAEEVVASEAPVVESTDGPAEEDTPVKVSSSDGEIEAQVNSIIQRITEEYESGRSGWQYHLTVDKDTHKETETCTEVPETKRNGHVASKDEELDVDLINKVKGVYLQPPLHYDSDSGSSCFRETEDEESTFEDDSSIASPSGTLKRQNRLNATMASRPSGRYYYMAKEILLTERTYVKDLEVLTVSFRGVLAQNGLVSDALMTLLFDNIDPLYDFHCSLLAELEERISLWERTAQEGPRESVQRIGDIMHRNMRQIKLYTSYIQRHDKILVELEREAKKSRKFEEAYKEFELQKICYLPLNAFLLKPVQRFLYYKSILGRLFKEYPKNHADYQDTKLAYDEIMDACRQVNDSMKNLENLHKLVELERDLIGVENLVHPGREFIREGCLHKICRKGPQARMFFLFTDLLMYTSQGVTSTNQFRVRSQIPLHVLRIEEGGVELHGLYAFSVSGPGMRSFVVAASSQEEKFKWMEDLNVACNKMKSKMMCSTCNANQSHLSSFVGKELETLCSACRVEVEKLEGFGEEERIKVINKKFPPPVIIKKTTQEIDSDDEGPSIMDQMSSLDRRHAHARTMSTRRVCWHRNTSISMTEYTLSVQNNISGELLRKFKNNNKWQRLWVVFTNFSLFFFKQYEDEAPLASLPLIGYTISKPVDSDNIYDEFAFKLQFKTHVYFFKAESEYAYERWMEVISSATKSASRTRIFSRMTSGDP